MATELGTAYVQIVPSARGISGSIADVLEPEATGAGKSSGRSLGETLLSSFGKAFVAVKAGQIIADAFNQGAALEQSIGGVETLFKESADKVKSYASEAYKTSGLSANEYMQNVTSFSASLLQSLGGDTSKAADIANTAMIDMSDNANKMGTNMRDIQNAYQGFAKQNYTMLDNLKLGYGGTKTEMERLLADAEKLTGVKYDINNLSDVYEAIHAVQGELGITGTTAEEAASTMSGSFGMMKAAWQDALGAITTGGNVSQAMDNLSDSVAAWVENLGRMIGNFITSLPAVLWGLIKGLGRVLATIGEQVLSGGAALISSLGGILGGLPEQIWGWISGAIGKVGEWVGNISRVCMEGISTWISNLGTSLAALPGQIWGWIIDAVSNVAKWGADLAAKGVQAAKDLCNAVLDGVKSLPGAMLDIGKDLVKGFWNGIKSLGGWLKDQVSGFFGGVWDNVKSLFGVNSPSKKFAWLGQMNDEGLALGMEDNLAIVSKAMDKVEDEVMRDMTPALDFTARTSYADDLMQSRDAASITREDSASKDRITDLLSELVGLIKGKWLNGEVVLDSGALVGALVSKLDEALAQKQLNESFGGGNLVPAI